MEQIISGGKRFFAMAAMKDIVWYAIRYYVDTREIRRKKMETEQMLQKMIDEMAARICHQDRQIAMLREKVSILKRKNLRKRKLKKGSKK